MNSRKFFAGVASAVMAVSMAGCGGDSGTSSSTGDDSSSSNPSTFIVGTTQELAGTFSPLYASTAYDQWVTNLVYESMLRYNTDDELEPWVATEMPTASEDGMSITFKLKEGLKFSDGSDLTADDVKFTFTLMADPEYIGQRLDGSFNFIQGWDEYQNGDAEDVSGIVVEDDYTITFTAETPNIDMASAIGTMWIMPEGQFEYSKGSMGGYSSQTTDVIGSNAYVVNSYDKSAGASLVLSDDYTGGGEYNIDRIIVKTIATGTEVEALRSGEIDLLAEEIQPDIIGPASLLDNMNTTSYFRSAEGYIGFNCLTGPTSELAVRQALLYTIDREAFVESYYKFPEKNGEVMAADDIKDISVGYVPAAFANPIGAGLGDFVIGTESIDGLDTYAYDMDAAKKLLDDAGWVMGDDGVRYKDGEALAINFLLTDGNSVLESLIPIVRKSWTELGVKLNTNTVDFNTMLDTTDPTNVDSSDWSAFFMAVGFTGDSNTTINDFYNFSGSGDSITYLGSNYARLADEALLKALNAGKETLDTTESEEAYKTALVEASKQAAYLPVYGNNLFNLLNKRVQNLNMSTLCNWSQAMEGASIDDSVAAEATTTAEDVEIDDSTSDDAADEEAAEEEAED